MIQAAMSHSDHDCDDYVEPIEVAIHCGTLNHLFAALGRLPCFPPPSLYHFSLRLMRGAHHFLERLVHALHDLFFCVSLLLRRFGFSHAVRTY
jgi:hypothetical protein